MEFRDQIAIDAMKSCLQADARVIVSYLSMHEYGLSNEKLPKIVADLSYKIADAMLEARKDKNGNSY